ncbi:SseB family protein [Propioniciclava flava]
MRSSLRGRFGVRVADVPAWAHEDVGATECCLRRGPGGSPIPPCERSWHGPTTATWSYPRAIAALCTARLLLPIVAAGDESGDGPDPDRVAEMAAVLVRSESGDTAVPVFTGLDALTVWKADARPVPCTLDDVAATAVETSSTAILIDLPGPHPVVIERELIDQLAQGRRLVELPDGGFGWMFREAPTA